MSVLSIDFETASKADLRKTGVRRYAADPSTIVLCMAWAFDDDPVQIWAPGDPPFQRVISHVLKNGTVRGWNVAFEWEVWNYVLRRDHPAFPILPMGSLEDTMARAAYWGLPLSLDKAGEALGTKLKDKAGHKLMLQMCRPRADGTWWHDADPVKYQQLKDYCRTDVEVEREIASELPPLPDREKQIWMMDRRINSRGVGVDMKLVDEMRVLSQRGKVQLDVAMSTATAGAVKTTSQTTPLLTFLQAHGYPHDDLKKDTIKSRLPDASGLERQVLQIRREAARASAAKLTALQNAAHKGRVHGTLQYYGASRTGRFAGRIFQPQNLPRPTIKNVDGIIAAVLSGRASYNDIDMLSTDGVMGAVASCIRGCLVAPPRKSLISADLSQIEARVVAWLAGQQDILDVFAAGDDVYVHTAAKIGSDDRQLGKVCVLGLGFGMGASKFVATAKTYGIVLTEDEATAIVRAWRGANDRIMQFWWDCDDAARLIATGAKRAHVQNVTFYRHGNAMLIELPSGRHLVYRRIRLEHDDATDRDSIVFDGVNQFTKQWGPCRSYGGKLVENIVQATARDVMTDAMLEIEQFTSIVLSVHDEVVAEHDEREADQILQQMLNTMTAQRSWTTGLPIGAAGWVGPRYRKG